MLKTDKWLTFCQQTCGKLDSFALSKDKDMLQKSF